MLRRLFTLLSVLSLVLFLVLCVLWVRSYQRVMTIRWHAYLPEGHWQEERVIAKSGRIGLWRLASTEPLPKPHRKPSEATARYQEREIKDWDQSPPWGIGHRTTPHIEEWSALGFILETSVPSAPFGHQQSLWVPYWFLVLLSLMLPVRSFRNLRRDWRRRNAGHCHTCGYDLRASPERCPECGAIAKSIS